jgi:hypothetical protein
MDEQIMNVSRPLGAVEYGPSGVVELKAEDVIFYYEYRPAEWLPVKRGTKEPLGSEEDWRELSYLAIHDEKTGCTTELASLYPEPHATAFRVSDVGWGGSYHDYASNQVALNCTLQSLFHFATLYHETGHANDKAANPHLYTDFVKRLEMAKLGDVASQSLVLVKERNAWAFALKEMRPFLSKDPAAALSAAALQKFIHRACLQDYSDTFRLARDGGATYRIAQ